MSAPKVVFEQYVIPEYRVPFFARLAEHVDLLVVASDVRQIDSVSDVRDGLPFASVRLPETPGTFHHPDLFGVLEDRRADVYISNQVVLNDLSIHRDWVRRLRALGVSIMWFGCDGYLVEDFAGFRRARAWPLPHPRGYWQWRRIKKSAAMVDGFFAYSSHTARYWSQVFDVPSDKIIIAHNAVDTSQLRDNVRRLGDTGRPRGVRDLVFVGRLTSGKRVDLLLDAFGDVSRRYPDATLTIVGEGSERIALEGRAREMGLRHVRFLGEIRDPERLAEVLYGSSLFVLPGLGGLGINTAMAADLPIICSKGDGTEKDLVNESENGWHVPPGDAAALAAVMTRALESPQSLEVMGRRSGELVDSSFSLDAMVGAFVEKIERTLDHGGAWA